MASKQSLTCKKQMLKSNVTKLKYEINKKNVILL